MRYRIVAIAYLLGFAGAALAQVGAPQLGWIQDGTHIRPAYGIAAAAAIGPAVLPDQEFSKIAASPAGSYVLAVSKETGAVQIYTPENGLTSLKDAGIAPDFMVLSPRGSAAALWFSSINQVQLVTGLPGAPSIRQIDASFLGSGPDALAISDDGAWLAEAVPAGVYAFGPAGEVDRLPVEIAATALAFLPNAHDLAAAGAAGVQMVTGIGGFAAASILMNSTNSPLQPVALASTADSRTLVLANQAGSVTMIDLVTGAASTIECGCQPEGLFGLGTSAFRLTGLQDGAVKLLDVSRAEVLFAPVALPAEAAEGAGQ